MKCIAQISSARVLKSNGIYKDISKIQRGESIINMYGKSVKVRDVIERKNDKNTGIVTIKHDNFFKNLVCTENLQILTWNEKKHDVEWVVADYFRNDIPHYVILPTKFDWDLPESFKYSIQGDTILSPSFGLGFLFGVYLRVGYLTQTSSRTIRFHCETLNVQFIEDIINICKKIFGAKVHKRQNPDDFLSHIDFDNNIMYDIFSDFGEDADRHLPHKYYCTDKDYTLGISTGIMYSGMNGIPYLHNRERVLETLYWSSLIANKPINYGQLVRKYRNIEFLTGRSTLYSYDRGRDSIWTIEVDCPTGTHIVNNLIVRND
jgi:hypothetical protein